MITASDPKQDKCYGICMELYIFQKKLFTAISKIKTS